MTSQYVPAASPVLKVVVTASAPLLMPIYAMSPRLNAMARRCRARVCGALDGGQRYDGAGDERRRGEQTASAARSAARPARLGRLPFDLLRFGAF
jgi:hypothetical protein